MKLLLIHQYFAAPSESGGTRHYEFAQHLIARGHEVTIVASDANYASGKRIVDRPRLYTKQCLDGIRLFRASAYPILFGAAIGWERSSNGQVTRSFASLRMTARSE